MARGARIFGSSLWPASRPRSLRPLGSFVATGAARSITAAAQRGFIAQPSISTAIKGLEADLGTPLFEHTRTGLVPTAGGARLYPRARNLLAESRAGGQDFRAAASAPLTLCLPRGWWSHVPIHPSPVSPCEVAHSRSPCQGACEGDRGASAAVPCRCSISRHPLNSKRPAFLLMRCRAGNPQYSNSGNTSRG